VSGISRPVDINTFNGSRTEFEKWIGVADTASVAAAQ
jgi:GH25 family lysozyme M1 (1,4-beta-N-acetylmuramidase)